MMGMMHSGGLPAGVALALALAFVAVALSHVRHGLAGAGQRRSWHACHVLIALGMAAMFLPGRLSSLGLAPGAWQVIFALAGLLGATWALGGRGRVSIAIWSLTSLDLGVMLYMWSQSGHAGPGLAAWPLAGFEIGQVLLWAFDGYRRLDRRAPVLPWAQLVAEGSPATAGAPVLAAEPGLLGGIDISASMIVMAAGMAYMLLGVPRLG